MAKPNQTDQDWIKLPLEKIVIPDLGRPLNKQELDAVIVFWVTVKKQPGAGRALKTFVHDITLKQLASEIMPGALSFWMGESGECDTKPALRKPGRSITATRPLEKRQQASMSLFKRVYDKGMGGA